jgi:hypothetical protein
MHIPDVAQIVPPPGFDADALFPAIDNVQNSGHDRVGKERWPLREAPDESIEEFLGWDLQVKWIAAGLNESLEQSESEDGDVWISMICQADYQHCCFARTWTSRVRMRLGEDRSPVERSPVCLLGVDVFCDFEMYCIVWFVYWRVACSGDQDL